MSYQRTDGRFVFSDSAAVASATKTATGTSAAIETGAHSVLRGAKVTVSAASGTSPTLVIQVQQSNDNSTWSNVGSAFTTLTAAGSATVTPIGPLDKYIRYQWTIGGTTPSFTFKIDGELV